MTPALLDSTDAECMSFECRLTSSNQDHGMKQQGFRPSICHTNIPCLTTRTNTRTSCKMNLSYNMGQSFNRHRHVPQCHEAIQYKCAGLSKQSICRGNGLCIWQRTSVYIYLLAVQAWAPRHRAILHKLQCSVSKFAFRMRVEGKDIPKAPVRTHEVGRGHIAQGVAHGAALQHRP